MTGGSADFDYFVVIAGMRTGSNLLEEILNDHPALTCHGELFNPHFVGQPKSETAFGITRKERNADPLAMVSAVVADPDKLGGFRLFDGHDPRVLDHVLSDPRCARIVLNRNPADSYVSLTIARATQQWWLGDMQSQKTAEVAFDAEGFGEFLNDVAGFRRHVRQRMQAHGQTAFVVRYEDLSDRDIVDGMFRYLGVDPVKRNHKSKTKVQNPLPLLDKVSNPQDLRTALARYDPFELDRIPDFEPERGAGAPGVRVCDGQGLMFLPVESVATREVDEWLVTLNGGAPVSCALSQRELKTWMRDRPGHRAFAVVDHPLSRSFDVFRQTILGEGAEIDSRIVALLQRDFGLPENLQEIRDDMSLLKQGMLAYLQFLRGTLDGQTGVRVQPRWASQIALLAGYAKLRTPDVVFRKSDLSAQMRAFLPDCAPPDQPAPDGRLTQIYDPALEKAARAAYRRDYAFLGFDDWRPD
jgi:LPS sulfotransferase NodH